MTKMSISANRVPSRLTKEQNHYEKIRIGDDPEYALAQKGRCLCGCGDIVLNGVWNQEAYRFLKQNYPDNFDNANERFAAAHPSLWSNGRNNQINGIFEVRKGCIYQVRGYDMANISFVRTKNGWLILDTLMSEECTYAALSLAEGFFETLGPEYKLQGQIKAVIISHSHVDHFGGVKAVCGYNLDGKACVLPVWQFYKTGWGKSGVGGKLEGQHQHRNWPGTVHRQDWISKAHRHHRGEYGFD